MSTKVLCDGCGKETVSDALCVEVPNCRELHTPTKVGVLTITPGRDLCVYCTIDAFKKLDDRPPAQPPTLKSVVWNGVEVVDIATDGTIDPHTPRFVGKAPELGMPYGAELREKYGEPVVRRGAAFNDARWFVHPETGEVLKANTAKSPLKITPRTPTDAMLKAGRDLNKNCALIWEQMWIAFDTVATKPDGQWVAPNKPLSVLDVRPEEPDPITHVPFGGGL